MNAVDFIRLVTETESLKTRLNESGRILYSDATTLKRGDFYLLGFNPGGPTSLPKICQDLEDFATRTRSAYLEPWGDYVSGQAPIQRELNSLIQALGGKLTDLCASNLIFMRSPRANGVQYPQMAHECWPIHREILRAVEPRVIISMGMNKSKSAYAYIKDFGFDSGSASQEQTFFSGHSPWHCKVTAGSIDGRKTTLLAIPHFSVYKLSHRIEVIHQIQGIVRAALSS